jgi:hypothetical protein
MHSLNRRRLLCAIVLLALLPAGAALPALVTLTILAALLSALIAYEALRYAEVRDRVRHQLVREPSLPETEEATPEGEGEGATVAEGVSMEGAEAEVTPS